MFNKLSSLQPVKEQIDNIAILKMNRPKQRNALNNELIDALKGEISLISSDERIKVVILKAIGPDFCTGHDLKELAALKNKNETLLLFQSCSDLMMMIHKLHKPVIAQVHGNASAAGCQLAVTCDLVFASNKSKFTAPGVNIGLFCSTPGIALSRNLQPKEAMKLLLTGDSIDSHEAKRIGLINDIFPEDQLDENVLKIAKNITKKSSESISIGKEFFYKQRSMSIDEAYQAGSILMNENLWNQDAQEGIHAFINKRTPNWK